ncbi:ciliogenesis and planar polarity effector 1 isoform X3 [Heterodontus francisci]|uniref:ciliogenesis and planar polarity effector 1 isoform X3 n=1 Tax=Heterodontus francisci TaxID=7792 RepID=UPI00355C1C64
MLPPQLMCIEVEMDCLHRPIKNNNLGNLSELPILSAFARCLVSRSAEYRRTLPVEERWKLFENCCGGGRRVCNGSNCLWDGKRVLLVSQTGAVFLWESSEKRDLPTVPGTRLSGRWAQVMADEQAKLPQAEDKDSTIHAVFHTDEVLGDCCFCSFVFTSGEALVLTTLELKWFEQVEQCISAVPFCVQWATQTHPLGNLIPTCDPVKSRGALLAAFSTDGLVLAVIINQNDPKATQVLFVNPLNCVTVSSSFRGCGSNGRPVSARFIRSYWVGAVSWTHDSLFLACMLKRGALLLLSRLGELVTITTFGCSVEFGPAEFIPLHPLITYRQPQSLLLSAEHNHSADSSTSENDPMRQRFSLAAHPRLPYLIVSDGYMFTVLRFAENYSASSVLKTLLLDVTQGLDDVRHLLMSSEHKDVNCCLQPMSSLKRSVLQGLGTQGSGTWTSPSFLQDATPAGGQTDEDDDSGDAAPCPTDYARSQNSDPSTMEQGHLEFASMFDTLHAKQGGQSDHLEAIFRRIQNSLLTAWSLGVSMKRIEGRDLLLQYTVQAFLQFARLLPFAPATLPSSVINRKNKLVQKALRRSPGTYRMLQLLRYCLSVLYWDTVHKHSLVPAVRLSAEIVKLILSQKLGPTSFSQSFLSSLLVLKLASVHLDAVYSLQSEVSLDLQGDMVPNSLLMPMSYPVDPREKCSALMLLELPNQTVQTIRQPSHRLAFTWRLLYQHALQYHSHLRQQLNRGKTRKKLQWEEAMLTSLLSQIQAAVQIMGERLGPNRQLKPLAGEEHFLLGSYLESVQIWRAAVQEEVGKDGGRVTYLQIRYSLAILYTHLYLYNLSAAQDLCEQLVRRILNQEGSVFSTGTDGLGLDKSTLLDVGEDAVLAVVQSLARFMALYFTNQPLFVLPPHHIDILPPLHFKPGCLPRVVPLQQSRVAAAVREQHLSAVWSVKYTVDLMLIGKLIPEAVWLAFGLGDWKTAVVLGLAFNLHSRSIPESPRKRWRSLYLPPHLHPSQIFQHKLQALLGCPVKVTMSLGDLTVNTTMSTGSDSKQFTDSIEEEDADVLFGSVQEILKAAVMADADVLTETFELLVQTAKDLGACLPGLVPDGLYLPAPPLYCPQPATDSEVRNSGADPGLSAERAARQKVSAVLQRVLMLFRAARCSLPAARWYISKLRYGQKIMNKIRGKAGLPPLRPFPDSLLRYCKARSSFFRPGAGGDRTSDAISFRVIGSFRDLCGLCWMFHVREQLSESCRKYQTARDNTRSSQDYEVAAEYDAAVVDHCLTSLDWACRLLPFARFMNVEELIQDLILSLVSELPPIRKVAEILVRAFPDVEDVRVPLRDKHHALQQRLRHSTVQGPDGEEMMSVLLHELYRQRIKVLKRTVQNIGPTEQHIWERNEEGLRDQQDQPYDWFSLGMSLSRSSLTDTSRGQNQGDGDTTDDMSVEFQDLSEQQDKIQQQMGTSHRVAQSSPHRNSASRDNGPDYRKAGKPGKNGGSELAAPCLPVVASWEFERDDEEYVKFLELFLSYLLERDQIVNEVPGVPLLTCCSGYLMEQELNSLAFQVHTTLKRRQSRTRTAAGVFRAKSCSRLMCETDRNVKLGCGRGSNPPVSSLTQGVFHSSVHSEVLPNENNIYSYFPAVGTRGRARGRGLFGLKLHSLPSQLNVVRHWSATPDPACSTEGPARADHSPYLSALTLSGEDLTPELEVRFQGTAKLLEWMIRWSERRLLCGPQKVETLVDHGTAIRVKTSVPAILRSLWLLDRDLGANTLDSCNYRDSERQFIVGTVYQPEQPRLNLDRESSVDTGYPGSLGTPVLGLEPSIEGHVGPFIQSDDAEDLQKQDMSHINHNPPQELTSDSDSRTDEEESADGQGSSHQKQDTGEIDGSPGECSQTKVRGTMCGSSAEEGRKKSGTVIVIGDLMVRGSDRHFCGSKRDSRMVCCLPSAKVKDVMERLPDVLLAEGNPSGELSKASVSVYKVEEDAEPCTPISPCISISIKPKPKPRTRIRDKVMMECSLDVESPRDEPISREPGDQMNEPISSEPGDREEQTEGPGLHSHLTPSSQAQPVLNCQSVSSPPAPALSVPVTDSPVDPDGQTVNTSDLVRNMLQDEMFKLVQLQQINFMSLMQVVGSSLTGLPSIQQQLRPAPSQNQAPTTPNLTTNRNSSCQVPAPGETECESPVMESNLPVQKSSSVPDENIAQNPEKLYLRPTLEADQVCRLQRIPDSQSVLTTGCVPIRPHLLLGPGAQPPVTLCQVTPGRSATPCLPLLRLQPRYELRAPPVARIKPPCSIPLLQPTRREAWVPCLEPSHRPHVGFPAHMISSAYDPEALRKAAEEKERKEELLSRGPPKHLNLDQYQQPSASHCTDPPASGPPPSGERFQREFQRPTSHGGCSQVFELPLLHLPQPTPMSVFPPSTRQPPNTQVEPGRPWMFSAAAVQCPRGQQQYRIFCPATQVSVVHPPRLIPAQDLIAFEQGQLCKSHQPSREPQAEAFRLLKVNIEAFEPRTSCDSKKRLKRRCDRRRAERTVCKLPQSDQRMGPPDPPDTQEEPREVPPVPETSGCFTLPLGSCGAPLADQTCSFATAAELHCWASTRKNAEERKDASTNTEQGPEPHLQPPAAAKSYTDAGSLTCSEIENYQPIAAAAVQSTPVSAPQIQVVPPDVFMNLQFPSDVCQKALLTPTTHVAPNQAVSGHKFLNVIDIDAGELLNDLPVSTTATELMPSPEREHMSIPGLHLMAASVTNAVPPDVCRLQESPSFGPVQPRSRDWEQQLAGDDLTQRLLQQDGSPVCIPPRASTHTVGTRQVRAQLSEMEHQLSALQDMAVNMEQDFANSKMLLNTIEHLHCAIDPHGSMECSRTWGFSTLDAGAALHLSSAAAEERAEDRCYLKAEAPTGSSVCVDCRHHSSPAAAEKRAEGRSYLKAEAPTGSSVCVDCHHHSSLAAAEKRAEDRCYLKAEAPTGSSVCVDCRHHSSPAAAEKRAEDRSYLRAEALTGSSVCANCNHHSSPAIAEERAEDRCYLKAEAPTGSSVCVDCRHHSSPAAAEKRAEDRSYLRAEALTGSSVCANCNHHSSPATAEERAEDRSYLRAEALTGSSVCANCNHHSSPATAEERAEDRCYLRAEALTGSSVCANCNHHSSPAIAEERAEDRSYLRAEALTGSSVCANCNHHSSPAIAEDFHLSADRNQLSSEMASSTDECLHLSGLSGISDIIADLFNEGKLSTKGLGLSEEQIKKLSRCSKPPKRSEQEQKEIREWMKRKRQQRVETYRQHREELRRNERAPYLPKEKQKKFTNKEIKETQKQSEMKKRVTLAENREQRTRAALSLMNEMLCDTIQLPNARLGPRGERPGKSTQTSQNHHCSTPRGRSAATRSLSACRAGRNLSSTDSMVRRGRSVSSSPGRTLQAGILRQAAQRRPCPVTGSTRYEVVQHKQARAACHQSSLRPPFRLHTPHLAEDGSDSEFDSLTRWSPPEQIQQILGCKEDPFLQAKADGVDSELSDIQSDSTSSILSNLDWNAVNKMIASLEHP